MVVSQNELASLAGARMLREGGYRRRRGDRHGLRPGSHPSRRPGNIGGGGFIVFRPASGRTRGVRLPRDGSRQGHTDHVPEGREVQQRAAPRQLPVGWRAGYRRRTAPGVEGTRQAAVEAARRAGGRAGARRFPRHRGAGALARVGPASRWRPTPRPSRSSPRPARRTRPATSSSCPTWLERSSESPTRARPGFYAGETAELIEKDMAAHGGLITRADLAAYRPKKRTPVTGTYRGYEIIGMPPISSGGVGLHRAAEHPRGLRPEGAGLPVRGLDARDDRGDAALLRRPGALPGRPGLRDGHAGGEADVEGVRGRPAEDHRPGARVEVVAIDASSGRSRATRRRTSRSSIAIATRCR